MKTALEIRAKALEFSILQKEESRDNRDIEKALLDIEYQILGCLLVDPTITEVELNAWSSGEVRHALGIKGFKTWLNNSRLTVGWGI